MQRKQLKVSDIRKIITDYHNEKGVGRKLVANERISKILKKFDIDHASSSPEMATLEAIFPSDEMRAAKTPEAYLNSSDDEFYLLKELKDEKQKKNIDEKTFAAKKKEIIKKAIRKADERPINGENLLKLTDLLLSDSITKLFDSKISSETKTAFQKLRNQFESGPAKLEDYKKLRRYRFYNEIMVDHIHSSNDKKELERYLTTLEFLNEKDFKVSEKKPDNYPNEGIDAEALMDNLRDNPDIPQTIKLLEEKNLLTEGVFASLFLHEHFNLEKINNLIKWNEDKKYEAIRGADLNLMLCKELNRPVQALDFCLQLHDAKILTNENKALVFNAITKNNPQWGENRLIRYLSDLINKNILDSKNIGIFCQSFTYTGVSGYALLKLTQDVFQKEANVAQQKKELEQLCGLFVMNPVKTKKIGYIAYCAQPSINISSPDLISLFKEDEETLDALYDLSHNLSMEFNQPDAFELVRRNPRAIAASISHFLGYNDKNNINIRKLILSYPEYTQLKDFKELILSMDRAGILTLDNVLTICNMPDPEATVQALLGLLCNDMAFLKKSELIQFYETGENAEYNKKSVLNFEGTMLTVYEDAPPAESAPRISSNQNIFNKFIFLLEEAVQLKAKATDDVLVSVLNIGVSHPTIKVTSTYYSSKKTAAVMLDEKIDFALDSFKDSVKTEKEKKQNAGTNLSALQTKLVDRMTELQENLSKIQQQEKSAINIVEEKIPQVRACIDAMLVDVTAVIAASPPGAANVMIFQARKYNVMILQVRKYSDILLTRAEEVDILETFVAQEKEEKTNKKILNDTGRLALEKQTELEKKYVQDLKGLATPAVAVSTMPLAMFSGAAAAVPLKSESIEDIMNEEIRNFKLILNSRPDSKDDVQEGAKVTAQSKEENVEFKIHSILNKMDDDFRNIPGNQSDSERLLAKMEMASKRVNEIVSEIDRIKRVARYTAASTTSSGGQFPDLLKRCQVYGQVIQNRIKTPLEAWLKINRVAQQKHGQVVKPKNFGDHKF